MAARDKSEEFGSNSFITEEIMKKITFIRGERVILDEDLSKLYGVTTGNLNKTIDRNPQRFPEDFAFRITDKEYKALKFHSGISKPTGRGGRRNLPRAYTEHGALMASTVLRTERANHMSVFVIRAFVRLRELIRTNPELKKILSALEIEYSKNKEHFPELLSVLNLLVDSSNVSPGERIEIIRQTNESENQKTFTIEFTEDNKIAERFIETLSSALRNRTDSVILSPNFLLCKTHESS